MNGSVKIGTAFGIPIRLHWTFLVLLYLVALSTHFYEGGGSLLPQVLVVFVCILLHELGHSLMARHFGIRVVDITFWPLGGMARMSEMPESPRIEGLVALAGPAVNFALALLAGVGLLGAWLFGSSLVWSASGWFLLINLMLGFFNLIPAFPMDGGRILRAWYGRTRDWVAATELAVRVGRVVAGMMLIAALGLMFTTRGICMLPLIPLFIWFAGARELAAVRLRHGESPFRGIRVQFGGPIQAEAHWDPARGKIPRVELGTTPFGPRRKSGGFTEEDIDDLENFRGRLRRPGDSGDET